MRTGNNSISNSTLQTINALEGNVSTEPKPAVGILTLLMSHSNKNVAESGLNSQQRCNSYLNLSKSTSTKLDTTLATPGDVEHKWAYAAKLSAPNNHPTIAEALAGPDAEEWQKAMAKEVSTFKKMDTYNLTNLPPGHKAIGNAWVFTLKRNANGTPARYKGQLVAQGFSQQPGIDFDEMFAPVVRLDSIQLLLSIANQNDWDIQQLDVNSAYLHAKVNEELYMQQSHILKTYKLSIKTKTFNLRSETSRPHVEQTIQYQAQKPWILAMPY
ncbi:Reverse transcriptase (RNA-dependent DNA polymerase) [Rhizoctonia solani]|uniref:Reverse transcriptase (RNA-dependent DNA polymerase) n=1 Tax=Rhizoctonia solani TaxID=456999 RepID=A0A8H7M4C0_9AGAM|nr:Reverse transcriptase (RNA-dependent DNA polymerase) [Rhizoctonia solani]